MICGESVFKFDDVNAPDLDINNYSASALLTEKFYEGKTDYDFSSHLITGDETKGKHLAQLLWRASTEVGFGYASNYIVARYCGPGNTPLKSVPAYGINVCPLAGCAKCPLPIPGLKYNNCFNDEALLAANIKRGQAESPPLKLDTDIAVKAQKWADELDARGSVAESTVGSDAD